MLPNLTFLLVALASAAAHSGTIEQATILADPQMQVKGGAVDGCGYRLKSIPQGISGLKSALLLDSSFNLYASGLALVKGGAVQVEIANGAPSRPLNKPIQSFWLKVQSENATVPTGKVIQAETKGYLLYRISPTAAIQLFDAAWSKTPITIGMRLRGEGIDRIYTGTVKLSESDTVEGQRCVDELLKQVKSSDGADAKRAKE